MNSADEHRPPLRDPAKSSSRADQIRQRVAVLSSSFRTLYLEWFARLSAQDFDEGDVAAILDAAEAELAGRTTGRGAADSAGSSAAAYAEPSAGLAAVRSRSRASWVWLSSGAVSGTVTYPITGSLPVMAQRSSARPGLAPLRVT
jgi:hypothetical protein